MDQKREGGQMSEDEEGLKGANLITRPGGEQMEGEVWYKR